MSSDSEDPYRVLGVAHSATLPEIKAAYRRLAREHHPDRSSAPEAAQKMAQFNSAYSVLSDPARRAALDHGLRKNNPPEGVNDSEGITDELAASLRCDKCGAQDCTLRFVSFTWVVSLPFIASWVGESGGLLCRRCQHARATWTAALTGLLGPWSIRAFPRSMEALWMAVSLRPRTPALLNGTLLEALAEVFVSQGRLRQARVALTEASKLDRNVAIKLSHLGGPLKLNFKRSPAFFRALGRFCSASLGVLLACLLVSLALDSFAQPPPPRGVVATPANPPPSTPAATSSSVRYDPNDPTSLGLVLELKRLEKQASEIAATVRAKQRQLEERLEATLSLERQVEAFHKLYPSGEVPSHHWAKYEAAYNSYEKSRERYNEAKTALDTAIVDLEAVESTYEARWAQLVQRSPN